MDIFGTSKHMERVKYARDFRNFNKHEFHEEFVSIDWSEIITETEGTEISCQNYPTQCVFAMDYTNS